MRQAEKYLAESQKVADAMLVDIRRENEELAAVRAEENLQQELAAAREEENLKQEADESATVREEERLQQEQDDSWSIPDPRSKLHKGLDHEVQVEDNISNNAPLSEREGRKKGLKGKLIRVFRRA